MRLFLFLVGGTGSRVLKPLIMQLAAGVRPIDENGNAIKDLEIIPIIMDPHKANEDLKRTDDLLRWYKDIRCSIYGDVSSDKVERGFFATRISTLGDLNRDAVLNDTFVFNLESISAKEFRDFINYNTLDSANQALCSMLFSNEQLKTKMDIGFVGSPNIGSVALNQFKDSEEFKQFANVVSTSDRVFIVSSIFGGTGAAGYPIIVKNIRNAVNNPAVANKGTLADAKIGALTVLPYFNIEQDKNSEITIADFISKTKSALDYYRVNLTGSKDGVSGASVNACYYLGDEVVSNPYKNDPGQNGQRNDAHFVEYVGATAILDFLSLGDEKLRTDNGRVRNATFKEYGLRHDKMTLSLMDFGERTRLVLNRQMIKFHIAFMYLTYAFGEDIGKMAYTDDAPKIQRSFLTTSGYTSLTGSFFAAYRQWLQEMAMNKRQFTPFNLYTRELCDCLTDIAPTTGFLKSKISYKTIQEALNNESKTASRQARYGNANVMFRLMDLLDKATENIIDKKYNSIV
ncbi:hypothetical protein [Prevotella sp. OH937_COT-195]|uniref:hypothetical protein n=1 Tax=Prevotella sp. OH937_COT-195 TaxID=2491051 RepID=UPI000F650436|nr:hypothetical protein [Prevotella sp. OH937_COT-195]RRC99515.1 hypothetical protein EII32_07875 [Prevotella sp. OH937_COT-195]